jgi:hypothetical protein
MASAVGAFENLRLLRFLDLLFDLIDRRTAKPDE